MDPGWSAVMASVKNPRLKMLREIKQLQFRLPLNSLKQGGLKVRSSRDLVIISR